jgi:hypothetical protein
MPGREPMCKGESRRHAVGVIREQRQQKEAGTSGWKASECPERAYFVHGHSGPTETYLMYGCIRMIWLHELLTLVRRHRKLKLTSGLREWKGAMSTGKLNTNSPSLLNQCRQTEDSWMPSGCCRGFPTLYTRRVHVCYSKCHVTSNKANSNLECAEDKFQTRGWVQGCEK